MDIINQIYTSDNLSLLKKLPSECINLIYSDILYGTGRDFKAYKDLKPVRSVIEDHYIPRIKEMYRTLTNDGVIYFQMDTRINHWMRIIMDDIFGYENFQNEISWCYNSQGKTNKKWNKKHDVIVFYSKSKNFKFYADRVMDSVTDSTYKRFKSEIDKKGYYTSNKGGKEYKYYLENGSLPKDWIEDITYLSKDNKELTGYPTQKPKELIKRFILANTDVNDLVGDFYLGSGTTTEVCQDLNRNYIACDINPDAVALAKDRLK